MKIEQHKRMANITLATLSDSTAFSRSTDQHK